jgi:hypothetical protein
MSGSPYKQLPQKPHPFTYTLGKHTLWFTSRNDRRRWLSWMRRVCEDYVYLSPEHIYQLIGKDALPLNNWGFVTKDIAT